VPQSFREFARPTFRDPRWLETQWFSAWTTSGMRLHFWAGFRTNLEVATTKVFATTRVSHHILDMDFADQQYHLPMGDARLSDFRLASGLSVKGHPAPRAWTVTYRSPCRRLRADLEVTALMDPLPLTGSAIEGAGPGFSGFHHATKDDQPDIRSGLEPAGHIDQTVRVVGEVVLDGERHEVDGVAQHDHSWSPRAEYHHSEGNFDQLHFGEELSMVVQSRPVDGEDRVTHAYVLRGSEVRQVREVSLAYRREGYGASAVEYHVVDATGERYDITGERTTSWELDMGPNIYIAFDQFRMSWDGREGVGETQWHHEVQQLQRMRRLGA
jgi:hypothetical protein